MTGPYPTIYRPMAKFYGRLSFNMIDHAINQLESSINQLDLNAGDS